jgi:hypothetical protein
MMNARERAINIINKWESPQMAYVSPDEMLEIINENIEELIISHKFISQGGKYEAFANKSRAKVG